MKSVALAAFTLFMFRSLSASAAEPCRERAAALDESLSRDARNARIWTVGWGITSAAVAGGSFALGAVEDDRDKRIGDFVWGGASLIPLALLVIFPLRVMGYPGTESENAPNDDPDGCAALARKEAFLAEAAEQEASGIAWYNHAAGIAFNVGLGVGLGAGLHQWSDNLISAGIGIFLCEFQILTQPVGAIRAQKALPSRAGWQLAPLAAPHARGLSLAVAF